MTTIMLLVITAAAGMAGAMAMSGKLRAKRGE